MSLNADALEKNRTFFLNLVLPILRQAGYQVTDASQGIKEIARANRISPQRLYLVMQADKTNTPAKRHTLPEQPVPGTGNLTLEELCEQYKLDSKLIADTLLDANYSLEEQMALKETGRSNHASPIDIYDQIRAATGEQLSD